MSIGFFCLILSACGSRDVKGGLTQEEAFPSNFTDVRNRIIAPKCANCHEDMLSHKILLTKYVVPGRPEESELYTEVKEDGMPLYSDKLLDEEKEAIRIWIEKGAPLD